MPPIAPLSAELHSLLIRPRNSSLVLGAAHHALYRPANAVAHALGGHVPTALDPAEWGAAAARAGEKVDYHLAIGGSARSESINLDNDHLKHIGAHLSGLHASDPAKAREMERSLNSVVKNHYNKGENIKSLVGKAHGDENFAATLHGVSVPSLSGEVGRTVKNVATDVAALYGAAEIMNKLHGASKDPVSQEKKASMTNIDRAKELLGKAAAIIDSLPAKEAAYSKANELLEAGRIEANEVEKIASLLERNPDDAETILNGMLRGSDLEAKVATLGEPVIDEPARGGSSNKFEALCLQGAQNG